MGKKEKRNYEDMDCLEVNLNVKAVIVYQGLRGVKRNAIN